MRATPRTRKAAAFLCVALVVFAAVLPGGASALVYATLTPLWVIVPASPSRHCAAGLNQPTLAHDLPDEDGNGDSPPGTAGEP